MEFKDYYKILGISKDASQDEIQRAYRKLARKYHPDVNKGKEAETRFKEINEAKEVLRDPEKRKLYDTYGNDWEKAGRQPPPGWGRPGQSSTGKENFSESFHYSSSGGANDFSDFFKDLFGGNFSQTSSGAGSGAYYDVPGESHEAVIKVDLEDVFKGATKHITFQTFEAQADGQLRKKAKTLQVKIPKGVVNGSVIRLSGQGTKGIGQGPDGDLFLKIALNPDSQFHVKGHDLHTLVAISAWEAALGAKIPVKTLDGSVTLTIPEGTQSGRLFRVKGKGLPKKGTAAGDIIIEIEVRVPRTLSNKEKLLFEELSKTSSFNPREERRQRAKEHGKV